MTQQVLIPLPGVGTLVLERAQFDAALTAGAGLADTNSTAATMSEPRLFTSQELHERLKIPATWFEEQARLETIPCVRAGKYVRFDLDEVLATLKGHPRIASARVNRK